VHSYIVQPSVVYGLASGPLVAAGLADRQSIAIPSLIQGSAARGRPGIFGTGTNVLPFVHIDDMADLYITLLDAILNPWKTPGHGWQGFYFGENGFLPYVDVSHSIGKALVQLGHLEPGADTPTQFLAEEVSKYFAAGVRALFLAPCHTLMLDNSLGTSTAPTAIPSVPALVRWAGSRGTRRRIVMQPSCPRLTSRCHAKLDPNWCAGRVTIYISIDV
jgi:hypothetical protein